MRIRHPVSFWLAIGIALVTALLSVALHGLLFIVAVLDVVLILALPSIVREEARIIDRRG